MHHSILVVLVSTVSSSLKVRTDACADSIRMGTTVATNALLERRGEETALLITKGFKDLLTIGNQARPSMFDLRINRPDSLYSCVEEVDERVVPDSCTDSVLRTQSYVSLVSRSQSLGDDRSQFC